MSTEAQAIGLVRAKIEQENKVGGDLTDLPCPFCKKPRSQRSTYIRCQPCGINWLAGEDPATDPRIDRFKQVVASARWSAA